MGPCVRSDLVTFGIHTLNHVNILLGDVNLALVDVVAGDEESRLRVIGLHKVQDMSGEDLLWAIVVGQSDCASLLAVVDTSTTVRNRSDFSASNGRGVGASRSSVIGTARTISVIAARSVAIVVVIATVWVLLVVCK